MPGDDDVNRRLCRILLCVALAGVGGGAWAYWARARRLTTERNWAALPRAEARRDDLTVTLTEVGVLVAKEKALLRAPFRGEITRTAEDGVWVKQGTPVIWLDTEKARSEFEESVNLARESHTDIERVATQLDRLFDNQAMDMEVEAARLYHQRLRLEEDVRDLEIAETMTEQNLAPDRQTRQSRLRAAGTHSQAIQRDLAFQAQDMDQSADRHAQARSFRSIHRRRDRHLNRADRAADRVANAVLSAPASGILQIETKYNRGERRHIPIKAGDYVHDGQDLAFIPDLDSLVVHTQVPEAEIRRVAIGSSATLRIDAFPDLDLRGRVTFIGSAAVERDLSPAGKVMAGQDFENEKVFMIEIAFSPVDERLRPGMTANVAIELDRRPSVVVAPLDTIFHRNGERIVYRDLGDRAEPVVVETGLSNRTEVEIRAGLSPGDSLLRVDPERTTESDGFS